MKITRENYEPFFLDYLEGNLNELLVNEFIEFLRQNPDLKEELRLFEAVTLPSETINFSGKEKLYRSPYDKNEIFDTHSVAFIEGDLSGEEVSSFLAYVETHPERKKELELFKETKLVPDESVTFRNKSKLYKQPAINPLLIWPVRIAAVLLISIALWNLWPSDVTEIARQPVVSDLQPDYTGPGESTGTIIHQQEEASSEIPAIVNNIVAEAKPAVEHPVNTIIPDADPAFIATSQRSDLEPPALLPLKKASLERSSREPLLATTTFEEKFDIDGGTEENVYLTDRLKEKAGLEEFSFARLVRSGLQLASDVSNDRISYATNSEGDIIALSLDTRLLGFRIPVGKK
jgi:hypothetical protein